MEHHSDLHLVSNSMKEKKSTSKGNITLTLVSPVIYLFIYFLSDFGFIN